MIDEATYNFLKTARQTPVPLPAGSNNTWITIDLPCLQWEIIIAAAFSRGPAIKMKRGLTTCKLGARGASLTGKVRHSFTKILALT